MFATVLQDESRLLLMSERRDGRQRDYEPRTDFQKWLKPLLDANAEAGVVPGNYMELTRELIRRGMDIDENTIYRVVRGDPAKYPNAKRPGYDVAVGIGEILGRPIESIEMAGYRVPVVPARELTRLLPEDTAELLFAYEGLPPAKRESERKRFLAEHKESMADYRKRSDVIGVPPEEEEPEFERIPDEE